MKNIPIGTGSFFTEKDIHEIVRYLDRVHGNVNDQTNEKYCWLILTLRGRITEKKCTGKRPKPYELKKL